MSFTIRVTEVTKSGYSGDELRTVERYSQTVESLDLNKIICAVNGITPIPPIAAAGAGLPAATLAKKLK